MGQRLDAPFERGMRRHVLDEFALVPDGRRIVLESLEHLVAAPRTGRAGGAGFRKGCHVLSLCRIGNYDIQNLIMYIIIT